MDKKAVELESISTQSLRRLAIYLEGIKQGKGNLLPLGTDSLENLWNTIGFLNGDVRYKCNDRVLIKETAYKRTRKQVPTQDEPKCVDVQGS